MFEDLQAEDLALEVAAKRRKAAASASSSLAGDSPAQQRDAAPSGSTAPSMRSAAPASDSAQAQQQSSSSAGAEGRPVEAERSSCHRHSLGVGLWWPSGSLGGDSSITPPLCCLSHLHPCLRSCRSTSERGSWS